MPQKECTECGESVEEAKAFCPQCGHAFVEEEKREEASVFESMEGTMQFGQTMYNQMLSDMGLNIKDKELPKTAREPAPQRILTPAVQTLKPAAETAPAARAVESKKNTNRLRIVGIAAAFLVLLLVIAAIAGAAVWLRYYN